MRTVLGEKTITKSAIKYSVIYKLNSKFLILKGGTRPLGNSKEY